MKKLLYFLVFGIIFFEKLYAQKEKPGSIIYTESVYSFEETYNRLLGHFRNNDNIWVFAEINHGYNARQIGKDLAASKLVIFGNPKVGTPLMQEKQLSSLDLPLKIMIWENRTGKTILGYSEVIFLKNRYDLKPSRLRKIERNLKKLSRKITGNEPEKNSRIRFKLHQGIKSLTSKKNFAATYDALKSAIQSDQKLQIFTEINHTQNAEEFEMGMPPSRLIIFGNPEAGTILMQEKIEIGLELPLKMLVWRDEDGKVKVSWNSGKFLKNRYGFKQNPVFHKIEKVQENLAKKAVSASE